MEPRTGTGPWPVRKPAIQQDVSNREKVKLHLLCTAALHHPHYCPSPTSGQVSSDIRFSHRTASPPVSCACERSGLNHPCENHPETIPHCHSSMERLSFMKLVPGATEAGSTVFGDGRTSVLALATFALRFLSDFMLKHLTLFTACKPRRAKSRSLFYHQGVKLTF